MKEREREREISNGNDKKRGKEGRVRKRRFKEGRWRERKREK